MSARTARDFVSSTDLWPIVEAWARRSDYELKRSDGSTRLYQRGHGFWMAAMMLEIGQTGDNVRMEAWVQPNFAARLSALFLIPAEMGIVSGGFRLGVPRRTARAAVNELLGQLEQPPIE